MANIKILLIAKSNLRLFLLQLDMTNIKNTLFYHYKREL